MKNSDIIEPVEEDDILQNNEVNNPGYHPAMVNLNPPVTEEDHLRSRGNNQDYEGVGNDDNQSQSIERVSLDSSPLITDSQDPNKCCLGALKKSDGICINTFKVILIIPCIPIVLFCLLMKVFCKFVVVPCCDFLSEKVPICCNAFGKCCNYCCEIFCKCIFRFCELINICCKAICTFLDDCTRPCRNCCSVCWRAICECTGECFAAIGRCCNAMC